jgi:hypothetical protein
MEAGDLFGGSEERLHSYSALAGRLPLMLFLLELRMPGPDIATIPSTPFRGGLRTVQVSSRQYG